MAKCKCLRQDLKHDYHLNRYTSSQLPILFVLLKYKYEIHVDTEDLLFVS